MKKFIFGIMVGIIFTIIIGVSASIIYNANEIKYSNSKTTATNVEEAINDLYSIKDDLESTESELVSTKTELSNVSTKLATANSSLNSANSFGTASASDILSGKTALIQGKQVTGTFKKTAVTEMVANYWSTGTLSSGSIGVTPNKYYILELWGYTMGTRPSITFSGSTNFGCLDNCSHISGINGGANGDLLVCYIYATSSTIYVNSNIPAYMSYAYMRLFD